MMNTTYFCRYESCIGYLTIVGNGTALTSLRFPTERHPSELPAGAVEDRGRFVDVIGQLEEYFAGRRRTFDLPYQPVGTEFQLRVWKELTTIPYGTTVSYGELAHRVGNGKASRAVGAANGRNPLPIIVPCHRVIGGSGKLVGFGGGLPIKQRLLELERHNAKEVTRRRRLDFSGVDNRDVVMH